jgi:hypothetical protein
MQIRPVWIALLLVSTNALAQTPHSNWFGPRYLDTVTASGFSSYQPAKGFVLRRHSAHQGEPCSNRDRYTLGAFSFEMTCTHWDELNHEQWGLGDVEAIHRPFEGSFHLP